MAEHLLDVRHLQTVFHMGEGLVKAVDDATFHVDSGEIIGIVGDMTDRDTAAPMRE